MKTPIKLAVAATLAALLGTTAALADDPQLRARLDVQRTLDAKNERSTTIAVYSTRGLGESRVSKERAEVRVERHDTGRGTHYFYRPAR